MALIDHWPLLGLVVRTPRLELRYPGEDLACALVELAAQGIHPPEVMPFSVPWTDTPAAELPRTSMQQWYWRSRADHRPDAWALPLAVFVDGSPAGVQAVEADDFGARRGALTGSWLARPWQGRGIGTEMRRAVLHLAFEGLGAAFVETAAWHDNEASLAVTRKLGYAPVGASIELRRGRPDRMLQFRMDRSDWTPPDDVELVGVEPCLPLLIAEDPPASA